MIIALDYDNTFTADKIMWLAFADIAQSRGHEIKIVTARSEQYDQIHDPALIGFEIIYCDGIAKKDVVNSLGHIISIWIDDQPDAIVHGSSYTQEMLAEWRANGRQ